MACQIQTRFRSDLVVNQAGRFVFDGYVDVGDKPPPWMSGRSVDLAAGKRFPRVALRACWWAPLGEAAAESDADQQTNWEGGPTATCEGE